MVREHCGVIGRCLSTATSCGITLKNKVKKSINSELYLQLENNTGDHTANVEHLHFSALVNYYGLRNLLTIWMIPFLTAFVFNNGSESLRESNVACTKRDFTNTIQIIFTLRTRPPIVALLRLNCRKWQNFLIAAAHYKMRSHLRVIIYEFAWIETKR